MIFLNQTNISVGKHTMAKRLFPICLIVLFQCLSLQLVYGQDCDATFTASNINPCGLEAVTFNVDNPNPSLLYFWNFGDPMAEINNPTGINDNTATGETVTHAFTANPSGASYSVTLTITNSGGEICGTSTQVINVAPSPVAVLSQIQGMGDFSNCATSPTDEFDLRVEDVGGGSADMYIINWGDGSQPDTFTMAPTTSHDYPVGSYILSYTVVDMSFTCSEVTAQYLVYNGINPGLGLTTDVPNTTICAGDSITFIFLDYETNTPDTGVFYCDK